MRPEAYFIYITTNTGNRALYTGVTNNLKQRIYTHKHKLVAGFTARYNINKLIYYEIFLTPQEAIKREKQIKAGSRKKKLALIKSINPTFRDLYDEI